MDPELEIVYEPFGIYLQPRDSVPSNKNINNLLWEPALWCLYVLEEDTCIVHPLSNFFSS